MLHFSEASGAVERLRVVNTRPRGRPIAFITPMALLREPEPGRACTGARKMAVGANGLRWPWLVFAFCTAVVVVILRQPDVLLNAQFVAEDGVEWFANAYNHGWFVPLFWPYAGYFVTLSRLAADFALLAPIQTAPLVMNLVGLLVQALPVPVILSRRLSQWGSVPFRSVLAIAYLLMPNCAEINVTVTEVQWHLALVACLLVLADMPRNRLERSFDLAILVLCGFTGPFPIFLFPVACFMFYRTREKRRLIPVGILGCAGTIQGISLLLHGASSRTHLPSGAGLGSFAKLLGGQIYLGTLVGHNTLALQLDVRTLVWISAMGTVLLAWALARSQPELRVFAGFCGIVFAAALYAPGLPEHLTPLEKTLTGWRIMAGAAGIRYWFFPTLLCVWMMAVLVAGPKRTNATTLIGILLLFATSYGITRDFRHPAYQNLHFAEYAAKLAHSKRGEIIDIPENPDPHLWSIRLKAR